jgi:hypothetical protein
VASETLNKARNEGLIQGFLIDTSTLAYRCGGSPGIKEPLNKSFRSADDLFRDSLTWFPFNFDRTAAEAPQTWREFYQNRVAWTEPKSSSRPLIFNLFFSSVLLIPRSRFTALIFALLAISLEGGLHAPLPSCRIQADMFG